MSTLLYPPSRRTRPPSPSRAHQAPQPMATMATTRGVVVRSGHIDTDMSPPRHVVAPALAALLCPSPTARRWAFITTRAMSPCPSWLRALRLLAPRGCTHRVAVLLAPAYSLIVRSLFFLFSTNFLSLQPSQLWHHMARRRPQHHTSDNRRTDATTTTRSATTMSATAQPARLLAASCGAHFGPRSPCTGSLAVIAVVPRARNCTCPLSGLLQPRRRRHLEPAPRRGLQRLGHMRRWLSQPRLQVRRWRCSRWGRCGVRVQQRSLWLDRLNGHGFDSLRAHLPSCMDRLEASSPCFVRGVFT
jgi:hypothetical protein